MSAARPLPCELADWRDDAALIAAAGACVRATRDAWQRAGAPAPEARDAARAAETVSERALEALLAEGRELHGIASERGLSSVVAFNAPHLPDALHCEAVAAARRPLDRLVAERLARHFAPERIQVVQSGHFLYPPHSFMGWHTNHRAPGWRLYLTHVDEPGRAFFRYRDPADGRIVTAPEEAWTVRLFRIGGGTTLWHAVHSDTVRTSFGYQVLPGGLGARLGRRLRRWHAAARRSPRE